MKAYQENWLESLTEFTTPHGKPNMENNVLGVCCKIVGDDTGGTDLLTQKLAEILRDVLAKQISDSAPATAHAMKPLTETRVRNMCTIGAIYAPDGVVTRQPNEYRREIEDARVWGFRMAEAAHGIEEQP